MKKGFLCSLFSLFIVTAARSQCNALFTASAQAEFVSFTNLSGVADAHYYWNFGDGTSSRYTNPVHQFPASGTYFVSLLAKDTISSCSPCFVQWITVEKYTADSCHHKITDSLDTDNSGTGITVIDKSTTCPDCSIIIDMAGAQNFPYGNWANLGVWQHARFVSRGKYTCPSGQYSAAYKSTPYKYSSVKNYGDCSANFEFSVVEDDSMGQRILFTAMNNSAASYTWTIIGFGDAVISHNDTISHYYPHYPGSIDGTLFPVSLPTIGQSGCKDTLFQQIISRPVATIAGDQWPVTIASAPLTCTISPNPLRFETVIRFASYSVADFTLFNSFGQAVRKAGNITGGRFTLNRDGLPAGMYHFKLRTADNRMAVGKMVVD